MQVSYVILHTLKSFSYMFYGAQTIVESLPSFSRSPRWISGLPFRRTVPHSTKEGRGRKGGKGALIFEQLHFRFTPLPSFFGWVAWRKMGHEFSNGEGRGRTAAENFLRQEN